MNGENLKLMKLTNTLFAMKGWKEPMNDLVVVSQSNRRKLTNDSFQMKQSTSI